MAENSEKEKSLNRGWLKAITQMLGENEGVSLAAMNMGVNLVGNALLSSKNTMYNPANKMKYNNAVQMYLDYVVNPATPKAAQDLVDQYQGELNTKTTAANTLEDDAYTKFNSDGRWKDKSNEAFEQYLKAKRPDVIGVRNEMSQASKRLSDAQLATSMPGVDTWKTMKERLTKVQAGENVPGLTMAAVSGSQNLDVAAYIPKVINGTNETVQEPTQNLIYVPAYELDQGYRAKMDEWYKNFDNMGYNEKYEIAETSKEDRAIKELGHTSENVESTVGWSWSYKSTNQNTKDWSKLDTFSKSGSIKIICEIKDKRIFNITVQFGFKKLFPYVGDKCPETVKNLVKSVAVLVASGVKLTVTMSDDIATSFDEEWKTTEHREGRSSFLGFSWPTKLEPNVKNDSTHKASWDAKNKTLTIEPTRDEGCAVLLAMIGEKLD